MAKVYTIWVHGVCDGYCPQCSDRLQWPYVAISKSGFNCYWVGQYPNKVCGALELVESVPTTVAVAVVVVDVVLVAVLVVVVVLVVVS